MGSPTLPQTKHYSQPIIFRSQGLYVCGLCLRGYSSHSSSHACLSSCARHVATERGVEVFVSGLCQKYRCCFCLREHMHRNVAAACVAECIERIFAKENVFEKRHGEPKKLSEPDLTLGTDDRERGTFFGYFLRKKKANPELQKKSEVIRKVAPLATPREDIPSYSAAPPQIKSVSRNDTVPLTRPVESELDYQESDLPKKPEVIKYRTAHQKPFLRTGAKYKCSVCLVSYFTGDEVKECFISHPLLEEKSV